MTTMLDTNAADKVLDHIQSWVELWAAEEMVSFWAKRREVNRKHQLRLIEGLADSASLKDRAPKRDVMIAALEFDRVDREHRQACKRVAEIRITMSLDAPMRVPVVLEKVSLKKAKPANDVRPRRVVSEETRRKLSESGKAAWARRRAQKAQICA